MVLDTREAASVVSSLGAPCGHLSCFFCQSSPRFKIVTRAETARYQKAFPCERSYARMVKLLSRPVALHCLLQLRLASEEARRRERQPRLPPLQHLHFACLRACLAWLHRSHHRILRQSALPCSKFAAAFRFARVLGWFVDMASSFGCSVPK